MKIHWIFTLLIVGLFACGKNDKPLHENAGGTFRLALDNEPSTFIARDVMDVYSSDVISQVMECLVSFDPKDLTIVPQIASSWKISPDGLSYEFTIRENVLFHPHSAFHSDSDRLLTVADVQKSIELICSKGVSGSPGAAYPLVFENYLKGAKDFCENKAKSISGLTVKGNKITFQLTEKDNNFLSKLAIISCAISSHKIVEANLEQDMIGTGPFKYREYQKGETNSIILIKNEEYYLSDENGFALPYLDSIVYLLESRKLEQLDRFENKQLDLIVGLPASRITKMLEGRISDFNATPPLLILQNNANLCSQYYYFNMQDERFKKLKVRQAFNYAIDKQKIGTDVLRNQYSEMGVYGVVPPVYSAFRGYDFKGVQENGYSFDPEKAKQLLAEAGYPNGQGFGSVNLRYNINDLNSAVADEFSKQILQVLGINVNIDGSTFDQLDNDGQMSKGEIFRSAWVADYPSPETFLYNFYGKTVPASATVPSAINSSRYKNEAFDRLFEQAKKSTKLSEQMNYFSLAEKEMMKNPPVIPLWYEGNYDIVYAGVRNLHFNSMNIFNFTRVYKKEWTQEEYRQAMKNHK